MPNHALRGLLLVLLTSSFPAQAVVLRHDRPLSETERAAEPLSSAAHFDPDGCGALVAPDWVLTAAHVARGLSPFGQVVRVAGHEALIDEVLFHPRSARIPEQAPEVDAALVHLGQPIPNVAPAPLYPRDDEIGRIAIVGGFGDFGHAHDPELSPQDRVPRAVTNRIEGTLHDYLFIRFDEPPDATELEGVGGSGDSGGPLYLEDEGVHWLAGISSFTIGKSMEYGSADHYLRVSTIQGWVRETVSGPGPPAPRIVDLTQEGSPEGPLADLARLFVAAFNLGPAVFDVFAAMNEGSAAWAGFGGRHAIYGDLVPLRYAETADDHVALLVTLQGMGGHRVVNLWTDPSGSRLRDVAFGIAKAP
ncbi:MAG TPA: trypsin-like serine protease [bacterium]|nr:trypsin-like serine protease [bacterium]